MEVIYANFINVYKPNNKKGIIYQYFLSFIKKMMGIQEGKGDVLATEFPIENLLLQNIFYLQISNELEKRGGSKLGPSSKYIFCQTSHFDKEDGLMKYQKLCEGKIY